MSGSSLRGRRDTQNVVRRKGKKRRKITVMATMVTVPKLVKSSTSHTYILYSRVMSTSTSMFPDPDDSLNGPKRKTTTTTTTTTSIVADRRYYLPGNEKEKTN